MTFVQRLRQVTIRMKRAARYSMTLTRAMFQAEQRRFAREALTFARSLPGRLDQPLPAALHEMTPAAAPQALDSDTMRTIIDALTAFGAGRPLGICLRRSLVRYHFLRRAGLPVVVYFGARRLGEGIGGHAWLVLDGEPYHELPQHYLNYAVMFTFPAESESPASNSLPSGSIQNGLSTSIPFSTASERNKSAHASGNVDSAAAPAILPE